MSSNQKGDRRERELVNELDDAGFAVMRAPASGSATARDLPDVLAGDGDDFYAIEAKSSAGDPIYLDGEEVAALVYFSRNFGAKARVGVRFDHEDWYFFHPDDLHRTDGGNYRVKLETAQASGTDFAELTGQSEKVTLDEVGDGGDGGNGDGGNGDGDGDADESGDDEDGNGEGGDSDLRRVLTAVDQGTLSVDEAASMLE